MANEANQNQAQDQSGQTQGGQSQQNQGSGSAGNQQSAGGSQGSNDAAENPMDQWMSGMKDILDNVPQMAQQALAGTRDWYNRLSPTQKAIGLGVITLGAGLVARQVMRSGGKPGSSSGQSQGKKNKTRNQ